MYLKTILVIIFICYTKVMEQYDLDYDESMFLRNECFFNEPLLDILSSYKPVIDYIMSTVKSKLISENFYEKYSTFIDIFGARPAGSKNLENAIDYMNRLTYYSGIKNVFTENVTVPHWQRIYESVQMIRPRFKDIAAIGLGPSVATPRYGITADVIVVCSFKELDKINNVQGKIILFNTVFTTYIETVVYRVYSAIKAAQKGAVAVLVRSITPFSLYTPHTGSLTYKENVRKIPAAAITTEDADFIQRLYNSGEKITINITMLNTLNKKISRNTIIDLRGRLEPRKMVIVSGHIDSWDVGQGAVDNGGGMMISWFVPVILNYLNLRPRRTIRSILWTAEEEGLIGGAEYIRRHYNELQDINFVLESDAGTFKPLGLEIAGSRAAKCLISNILKLFWPINKIKLVNNTGSEMSLFVNNGIPGASLLNQDYYYFLYHHSNADTLTAQIKQHVVNCAAFWAAISYVIADIPIPVPRD
ncbi:carboxypeptidase Q-like [Vanessa cardui]|uniref:carboxypeptidase Q-like n=1 Tax=Vanessa cardui TaxID=171605 RepID=UPI001F138A7D|nr:carboxypeptidase Q-like [Vanessa cardui]